jgi:hypothetical protein
MAQRSDVRQFAACLEQVGGVCLESWVVAMVTLTAENSTFEITETTNEVETE